MSDALVFREKLDLYRQIVEESLPVYFVGSQENPDETQEAALYSLRAGGKRIRPVLFLATAEMLSVEIHTALPFACALEMIHTYSLIHDDLPCMDNDTLRRGKPTCHVAFSEAIALLAGDALLNRAYEVLLSFCMTGDIRSVKAAEFLSRMAGAEGMIGGQTADIMSEGKKITPDELFQLHRRKTGCLLLAPLMMPFYLSEHAESNEELGRLLHQFASHIGLAFQIKDDILDVVSTDDALGKSVGKDAAFNKSTFVTLFGMEKSSAYLSSEIQSAFDCLVKVGKMGFPVLFLRQMTEYLFTRDR